MSIVSSRRLIGTKFYTFEEGIEEAIIYRLVKYKESKGYFTLRNIDTGDTITLTEEELVSSDSRYTLLRPDGILAFTVARMPDDAKDVIVTVHDIHSKSMSVPACVCRQCVEDIFINKTAMYRGKFHIGISVSQYTCPSNVDFNTFLIAKDIEFMVSTAIYIDDTLDIIRDYIFPGINIKKFDKILTNTKALMERTKRNVHGCVDNVYDLLSLNNFMYDFRSTFGIVEMDIELTEDTEYLTQEDAAVFANVISEDITATYVLKYSKEFDMNSIKRKFVLVNPKKGDTSGIYIVAYDAVDTRTFVADRFQDNM